MLFYDVILCTTQGHREISAELGVKHPLMDSDARQSSVVTAQTDPSTCRNIDTRQLKLPVS